jgi:hypothetical protein
MSVYAFMARKPRRHKVSVRVLPPLFALVAVVVHSAHHHCAPQFDAPHHSRASMLSQYIRAQIKISLELFACMHAFLNACIHNTYIHQPLDVTLASTNWGARDRIAAVILRGVPYFFFRFVDNTIPQGDSIITFLSKREKYNIILPRKRSDGAAANDEKVRKGFRDRNSRSEKT